MSPQRTYWHLEGRGRVPSSYEVETTRLLYYPERGFELPTAGAEWHEKYRGGSRLRATFGAFADPRQTTYASYVRLQHEQESFIEELLRSAAASDYDAGLDPTWRAVLGAVLPVLRYPCHGLHMLACYLGHLAPEGRVVTAFAFSAGDELRRTQWLAYRMRQLQYVDATFGESAKSDWQRHPAWQPLREVVERLLVTYDFGEALIATNVVFKPAFDQTFMHELGKLAIRRGDRLLAQIWFSLEHDCRWHRSLTGELLRVALEEHPDDASAISEWIGLWWPRVQRALEAALDRLGFSELEKARHMAEVSNECRNWWSTLGVPLEAETPLGAVG